MRARIKRITRQMHTLHGGEKTKATRKLWKKSSKKWSKWRRCATENNAVKCETRMLQLHLSCSAVELPVEHKSTFHSIILLFVCCVCFSFSVRFHARMHFGKKTRKKLAKTMMLLAVAYWSGALETKKKQPTLTKPKNYTANVGMRFLPHSRCITYK